MFGKYRPRGRIVADAITNINLFVMPPRATELRNAADAISRGDHIGEQHD